jgi:hypothetical protein
MGIIQCEKRKIASKKRNLAMLFEANNVGKRTQHTATSDKKRRGWEGGWIRYHRTSRGGHVWLRASVLCLRKLSLHGGILLSNTCSAGAIERGRGGVHLLVLRGRRLLCGEHLRSRRRRRRHSRGMGLNLLDRKRLIHLSEHNITIWPLRGHGAKAVSATSVGLHVLVPNHGQLLLWPHLQLLLRLRLRLLDEPGGKPWRGRSRGAGRRRLLLLGRGAIQVPARVKPRLVRNPLTISSEKHDVHFV